MKTPRRISDLIARKQSLIDANRDKLEKLIIKQQSKLFNAIVESVIAKLDVKDDVILDTPKNYRLLADVDVIFDTFTKQSAPIIASQIAEGLTGVAALEAKYFKMVLPEGTVERFESIVSKTKDLIDLRVGLKGGETVSGGFIESLTKNKSLSLQVKDYIARSVTGQIDSKDFIKGLSSIVTGKEDGPGAMEKDYQRYAYDLYQQYDRAYSTNLATEFDMKYFVYQGTLIEDSRDFCVAHAGKVWTIEEAQEWKNWNPSMGEYPEGYKIRQKDVNAVPSYIDYPGYNPLVDAGGYRCRHSINYVSDELAFKMRPELKKS